MIDARAARAAVVAVLVFSAVSVGVAAGGVPAATSSVSSTASSAAPQVDDEVDNSTAGYTVRGLSRTMQLSGPDSVRRWGEYGQIWLRHVPVGLLVEDDVERFGRYVGPRTTVQRKAVYLGSYRGWEAESLDLSLKLVAWDKGTRTVNDSGTTRRVSVPRNVSEKEISVTLPGGGYDRAKVELPRFYDSTKRITMWVEGHREATQWTFRLSTSKATESVPVGSLGGVIKWSLWNVFLWTLVVAGGLVVLDARVMREVGRGPQWGVLEYGFLGFASLFLGGFVFYSGVMDTLARRPQLLGVLGGLFVGGIMLHVLSDPGEKALFLQPRGETTEVHPDGSGTWWWSNRVHTVVEREKDGKKVIPRRGWLAFLARAWPFLDATPVLEFDASEARKLESPPSKVELPENDDADMWEKVRTAISGKEGEDDEFDTIYLVDPLADSVVQYDEETFALELPDLVTWPDDEDSGTWIRGVPVPSIAFGKILGGSAVVVLVGGAVSTALASAGWGIVGGAVALLVLVTRPVEGAARVELAPAHFDAVLGNLTQMLEGYSERADADHFREKYHESDARRRVESVRERERDERTVFGQLADRLAPEDRTPDMTGPSGEDAPARGEADD